MIASVRDKYSVCGSQISCFAKGSDLSIVAVGCVCVEYVCVDVTVVDFVFPGDGDIVVEEGGVEENDSEAIDGDKEEE